MVDRAILGHILKLSWLLDFSQLFLIMVLYPYSDIQFFPSLHQRHSLECFNYRRLSLTSFGNGGWCCRGINEKDEWLLLLAINFTVWVYHNFHDVNQSSGNIVPRTHLPLLILVLLIVSPSWESRLFVPLHPAVLWEGVYRF